MGNQKNKGQKAKQTMPPKRKNAQSSNAKASAPEEEAYNRLIIVGSSRINGRSAALAQQLFDTCLEEYPDDAVTIASVASLDIDPCIGCSACRNGDCVIDDDMASVLDLIASADEVIVVSPVYFAGPPAQFKALLDRLQPFFFTDARHQETRPLTLHIIGEGHDPFGYDPLVTCVSSAFYCAGFVLDQILDWVGKIDASGEIIDDPDIFVLSDEGVDDYDDDEVADPEEFIDEDFDGLHDVDEELKEF
ncbi:MAG: flavodoxin family protein [Eggerthellaceae bacterium]|nr:flavodoxin family protein [Eggerthellaceae bacterium]